MPTPNDPKVAARSSALHPLFAINLIGVLGFSIVLPFLVFLVTGFGGNAFVYGLAGATYPAFRLRSLQAPPDEPATAKTARGG
jgi:DHA1 family tetracycline resistance protein-like MFS transporter